MLFRRRKPLDRWGHVRQTLWPRKGFARPFLYRAKCALRLHDSSHAIALGVAIGAFVSFTPLMGLHILMATGLAWLLRGNVVAALLGTAVGNPFTFPAIWLATYRTGSFVLGRATRREGAAENLTDVFLNAHGPWHDVIIGMWHPLIWPMLVGGLLLGLVAGVALYALTRQGAGALQAARAKRLAMLEAAREKRAAKTASKAATKATSKAATKAASKAGRGGLPDRSVSA